MTPRIYAGIGSRKAPTLALSLATQMAGKLAAASWTLRSGGAPGMDTAFEVGAGHGSKEIYIPWAGFEQRAHGIVLQGQLLERALLLAAQVHPNWGACNYGARLLHARNVAQIYGADLQTPVELVLCWAPPTPDGSVSGGTRTAVELARRADVPVYNFATAQGTQALQQLSL